MVVAAVAGAWGLSGTLKVRTRYLVPILMLFSVIGAFASRNAAFDVYVMLAFGAFGYLMKRTGYSPAAVVMGLILAPIADNELVRVIQIYGSDWYLAFLTRPIAVTIIAAFLTFVSWRALRGGARKKPDEMLRE